MATPLEKLTLINPGFKQMEDLLSILNKSETVQALKANTSSWTLDEGQILLPLSQSMWEKGIIDQQHAFEALAQEGVDPFIIAKCLSGEFGNQLFAWMIAELLEIEIEENEDLLFLIPSVEELKAFLNKAYEFILLQARIYLFSS